MEDAISSGDRPRLHAKFAQSLREKQLPRASHRLSMADGATAEIALAQEEAWSNLEAPTPTRDFAALRSAFALFDADGDGKVTGQEVIEALTRKTAAGTELSFDDAQRTWLRWQKEFDINVDYKISIDELARIGDSGKTRWFKRIDGETRTRSKIG